VARQRTTPRIPLVLTGALAALVGSVALAAAATGDLTFQGCIKDSAAGECAAAAQGLAGPQSVAVSPDGRSVYAVSGADDAIVILDRDPSNGALSNPRCIRDAAAGECGASAEGLDDPRGVAVSPDNKSVYVASFGDSAIVRFDRDATTGALSNPSCIKDSAPGECGASTAGLLGAIGIAVSPDNKSVYVASINDGAIVRFNRDTTGALSSPSCVQDGIASADCGSAAPGLAGATSVAVSPDNKSVYVASLDDSAIVRFDRDTTSGALSNSSCIKDAAAGECGGSAEGLNLANGVAVSPDANSVYVASQGDSAIVRFDRDTASGALSNPSCIKDSAFAPSECGGSAEGLLGAAGVAVSPDARSVYVASFADDAVVEFDRTLSTGALSNPSCIKDSAPGECGASAEGLASPWQIAVAPDDRSVYVTAINDNAVVRFDREPLPPPPPPDGGGGGGGGDDGADTSPPDTTITGGPKAKTKKKSASFAFSSSEPGSTFECKLDDGSFESCSSPKAYKVKPGKHSFAVRAKDSAGNVDPTPATKDWKVKKKK
jgi:DNA-binding beta-propeller fold protein YncE